MKLICHAHAADAVHDAAPAILYEPLRGIGKLTKQLLIMKLTLLLIVIFSFQVTAHVSAQKVSLRAQNQPLGAVLKEIGLQSGFSFIYDDRYLDNAAPVSLHVEQKEIGDVLGEIFANQPFHYTVKNSVVTVVPRPERKRVRRSESVSLSAANLVPVQEEVRGRVVDSLGNPLAGASVRVLDAQGRRTAVQTKTDVEGRFELFGIPENTMLEVIFVGYGTVKMRAKKDVGVVVLKEEVGQVEEIVINTGYQKLKPNEMAGAVDVITKEMLMEQTGTTVMERLVGMSGSLNFSNKVLPGSTTGNPNSILGMTVRGYSTINGTTDPLIIVNNFPYTGDIDNLDPNDIENIVILKDAAATAMWGIRAANGVIVITTSGSKFNQKTRVNFRTTTSITPKPDLNKVDVADGPEAYDFLAEYRGNALAATINAASAVPELDYLGWQYYKKGLISKDEFDTQLNIMKALNPRKQWSDLLYRNGNTQTYSLNISGGSESLAWTIAGSFDQGMGVLQAKSHRSNIRMNTIYKLTDNLSVELGIAYTNSFSKTGAPAYNSFNDGGRYMVTRPLANADGSPYGWWVDRSPIYMDTVGEGLYGDLKFYALEDWKHDYTKTNLTNYVKNFSIKYSPFKDLDISGNFQSSDQSSIANNISDRESYFTRYYLALNSEINRATKAIKYHIPIGEFRRIRNTYAKSMNARIDINYRRAINKGMLLFNGAFDVSESKHFSDGSFLAGYNETPRSYIFMPSHSVYSSLQNGTVNMASAVVHRTSINIANLIAPSEITQRNISTTASLSYVYDDRIIFNANARRDGANIIGVNVNERWKPNYSLALNWKLHKEKFFNLPFVSNLSTGISFGYVGNVDVSKSSRIVANVSNYSISNTNLESYMQVSIPPNPELRWEKTAHTNFKLDIGLWKDRLQIRTNYFIKNISDLYLATPVDHTQALPGSYVANVGKMNVKGYEINLQAKVIQSKINYDITFTTARINEKMIQYPNTVADGIKLRNFLLSSGESFYASNPVFFKDMPLFSIFSLNGNQGVNDLGNYFINYKGVDYINYINLQSALQIQGGDMEGVKLYGTSTPKFTGSMHHRINYKRFFVLFSLQAELGHYFKYPKDVLSTLSLSSAYYKSWKNPGDELHTNVPHYNPSMDMFTYFADHNIFKGDIIRLNNIQVNYAVPTKKMRSLNLSLNIQNLGKIWTANKEGYDYQHLNYMTYNGQNRYYALTLNIGL